MLHDQPCISAAVWRPLGQAEVGYVTIGKEKPSQAGRTRLPPAQLRADAETPGLPCDSRD